MRSPFCGAVGHLRGLGRWQLLRLQLLRVLWMLMFEMSESTRGRLSLLLCRFTLVVRECSHYKCMRPFVQMSAAT